MARVTPSSFAARCLLSLPLAALAWAAGIPVAAAQDSSTPAAMTPQTPSPARPLRIRIAGGTLDVQVTLNGSVAAADFVSMLPLSLTLEDYAATEKIAQLPRKLDLRGAPPGADPAVGDLAYYAPWGNLALYYRDAPHAAGVVPLGRIDSGLDALHKPGPPVRVRIERLAD